jgi:type I restriction enzyme S subunit
MTQTVELGVLCRTTSGGTPSRANPSYFGGDIPWVKSGELNDSIITKIEERITRRGLENSNAEIFPSGTLLIALYGATVGKLGILGTHAATNQAVCAIFPSKDIDRDFLRFYLLSRRSQLVGQSTGGAQPNISQDIIRKLLVPVPPLSEQQRTAGRLEQADRLRRTRSYALELGDTFLPAAFLELFGDPLTNQEATPVVDLGQFLSFVTSGARGWAEYYVSEGSRFIRSLDVRMNFISDEDAVFVIPPEGAEANRTRVRTDDVLLTITGSQIGRIAPVPARLNGAYVSQHVAILRLMPGVLPVFLSWYLSLDFGGQREIARLQYGQTKPGLNFDQIREFRIPLPSVERQQRFAVLVARHKRLRAEQRDALRQADHLFQTLLHQSFVSAET